MIWSPITEMGRISGNQLYMKREDLIPFSFGGNKARKAALFFQTIDSEGYDCIVTYGSSSSNHCRIIANHCCKRNIQCFIISPVEQQHITYNTRMMNLFGAQIIYTPVNEVSAAIDHKMEELRSEGKKPFMIEGGGHGDIGTEAYVQCYREICEQEKKIGEKFDYIFFASGTGTTQAGLVCGQLLSGDDRKIIGISIARKNPRGRDIVIDSIRHYLNGRRSEKEIQEKTVFLDTYTTGYGQLDQKVLDTIRNVLINYGVPMDETYTGKAFTGMIDYLEKNEIYGKNILFIHTGGTPLFFDLLPGITEV